MPLQNKNSTTMSAEQNGHAKETDVWRPPTCFSEVIEIITDHCRDHLTENLTGMGLIIILFLILFFI